MRTILLALCATLFVAVAATGLTITAPQQAVAGCTGLKC